MSDEMVQENTDTENAAASAMELAEAHKGSVETNGTVSSKIAATDAATYEPNPTQSNTAMSTVKLTDELMIQAESPQIDEKIEDKTLDQQDIPATEELAGTEPISIQSPVAAGQDADETSSSSIQPNLTGGAATPLAASTSDERDFAKAMEDFDTDYDRSIQHLQQDTVVTGTVMRIDREGVLVDVGAKSEGIIRLHELSRQSSATLNPENIVKVGEQIRVYVIEAENQDGIPVLSKKRADFEQAWEVMQAAKESGETLMANVSERVKGGLVVDLGIRGFVPASHVGSGNPKNNLDKYVGQQIALKVIEVDKERHKVVLSNKMAAAEERETKSAETKASLTPGQKRKGLVRRLTTYGAFIDLGGIDGLLHISEMSWTRINDPKEILREGQEVEVVVLKMDIENNRVSLGLRQILPDPWSEIPNRYKEGDVITGTITRLVPFGAFVQVEGGVEGIIHNMELPRNRGGKGVAALTVGDEVTVKILAIMPEARKMTLSMRALQAPEEREQSPSREPSDQRESGGREGGREGGGRESGSREGREGGGREGGGRESGGRDGGGREPSGGRDVGNRESGGRRDDRDRGRETRGRSGERHDDREDYARFAPGQSNEPRFSIIGDAFAAARKTERNKRDRRGPAEDVEDEIFDLEEDEPTTETIAETPQDQISNVATNVAEVAAPTAGVDKVNDEKSE